MKRVAWSSVFIGLFIVLGTVFAIFYAKGYRILPQSGRASIEGTGLLVLTSKPDGARVLIDGDFVTATNNTINLFPGTYSIEIQKDGYISWKKTIQVKKEVVTQATALLIPAAPKLEAVTTTGVDNIIIDSSYTFLAYMTASASAQKNGIYVLDMRSTPLISLGITPTQIVNNNIDDFSNAALSFSPDTKQLLATTSAATYLLSTNGINDKPQNVSSTLSQIEKDWQQQQLEKDKKLADALPKKIRQIASSNFKNMSPSPDGDKILYSASISAQLPVITKKRLPGENTTPEDRNLKPGNLYVYDIKEDRNYLILDFSSLNSNESLPKYLWHPDSNHLIFAQGKRIYIIEFDAQNKTTIYAGPFLDSYVFPWPDGSSTAIVTRLSPEVPYNLYRISLK